MELKKFVRDQNLVQGLLVTYSPMHMMGDSIRAEIYVGKKALNDLKQRIDNHLVILKDCVPTQSGHGRLQTEKMKHPFMGALCIDRAVMKRKSSTR